MFGPFPVLRTQTRSLDFLGAPFAYAAEMLVPASAGRQRLNALAAGTSHRHELTGGAFAMEQAYLTRTRPGSFFETHRKYIDLQVMIEGEEWMEVEDRSRLSITEPYSAERDVVIYADPATASRVRLRPGDAALYFPDDGHMGCLQVAAPVLVRKVVVKIPVAGK